MPTKEQRKVEKRYKQTQELWGELKAWSLGIVSISLLLMASFGTYGTYEGIDSARVMHYLIPSLVLLFAFGYAWINRKANLTNNKLYYQGLRGMGIAALLISFGYGIYLITSNSIMDPTILNFNVSWLTINLIMLGVATFVSFVTITSSSEKKVDKVEKVYTDEITKEDKIDVNDIPSQTREEVEQKTTEQADAIAAAIEAYKNNNI